MDITAFEFLLTDRGQRLLAAGTSSYDGSDVLALSQRLRGLGDATPDQVSAAVTQITLRRSAEAKFGVDAARMYFTPAGLEQATHPVVARHRARRAASGGVGTCLDLGCGIGSDLIAFAQEGFAVTGVEQDVVTARVAAANLAALALDGGVRTAAVESMDLVGAGIVFADPSRRKGAKRVFDPRAFSPPWEFVLGLLERPEPMAGFRQRAAVKLAPGLDHGLIPPHVEAEWVSLDGELKEAVLWSPAPAPGTVRRRATLLARNGGAFSCSDESASAAPLDVADVGAYLHEPDPAVIRAHLVSAVAAEVEGWLIDPHIAYVSSDREVTTRFAKTFRVVDVLPFKEKALRAALRARNVGALTIKKRGVAVAPEDLRRRLSLRGDEAATIVLTRTPRSAVALLVEPVE